MSPPAVAKRSASVNVDRSWRHLISISLVMAVTARLAVATWREARTTRARRSAARPARTAQRMALAVP
jgi:hypothetical protein